MVASPAPRRNSKQDVTIDVPKAVVLLGRNGAIPDENDVYPALKPLAWSRSAGGERVDALTFELDLARLGIRIRDVAVPKNLVEQAELRFLDDDDRPTIIAGWGFSADGAMRLGATDERIQMTYRIDKHHFGKPLTSYPVWDKTEQKRYDVETPLIWNPERTVNGTPRIMGNQSDVVETGGMDPDFPETVGHGWYFMLDPDADASESARTYQDQVRRTWLLQEAVHAICWWLNPDETWIKNPTLEELNSFFEGFPDDGTRLKNQPQTYGKYLPEALDELLAPHGIGWFLANSIPDATYGDTPPVRNSKIQFYYRGVGPLARVYRQRPGAAKNVRDTNVNDFAMSTNIVELANVVQIFGDLEIRENTWELIPGWPETDDPVPSAKLSKKGELYGSKPWTHRKWVLNEAGDYITDPAILVPKRPVTAPYDLRPYFTEDSLTVRRRRFLPCLSEFESGEERRFHLEWWDLRAGVDPTAWSSSTKYTKGQLVSFDGGVYVATSDHSNSEPPSANWTLVGPEAPVTWNVGTAYPVDSVVTWGGKIWKALDATTGNQPPHEKWKDITSLYAGPAWKKYGGQFHVLENECGILFDTDDVPLSLWSAANRETFSARLRITCCIQGDRRVQAKAARRDVSPNGLDVQMTLYMPDQFQDAQVVAGSLFAGEPNHARDDSDAILAYAQNLRAIEDCAEISCSVLLEGVHHPELKIGMLLDRIDGLNVSLNALRETAEQPRRLQIVGFNHDWTQQSTEVLLETFKMERRDLALGQGFWGGRNNFRRERVK